MDLSQYRGLFISEARGHISACGELLVHLEKRVSQRAIDELFRHVHSMKGMAATMQYRPVTDLAHHLEELLGKAREQKADVSPAMTDLLLECCDRLADMITIIESGGEATLESPSDLLHRLRDFTAGESRSNNTDEPHLSTPRQQPEPTASHLPRHQFRQSDSFSSVRIRTEALDQLTNLAGELLTTRHTLVDAARQTTVGDSLQEPLGRLSALLRQLRGEVLQARMLPFSVVAERFPRLVRDLARHLGKQIDFTIEGREIELDRAILEEIAEPLVHILRNAIDHGLESPEERRAAGKPPNGRLDITVTREKNHASIAISDDGRGMDPALLIRAAMARGIIDAEQAAGLSPQEALLLVCAPGFSTAGQVSDISGRGVGMDAVRHTVRNLAGTLAIDSTPGQGSRFLLRLPITVAIIPALLAECGSLTVAFPVSSVERTLELRQDEIAVEDGFQVCRLAGVSVPLASLNDLLEQSMPEAQATDYLPVIVSNEGGALTGLRTDRILGQREIFVKPLGAPLSSLRGITGGTITGDGGIVFVLDASTLRSPMDRT